MPSIHWPYLITGVALSLGGWALYWAAMHLTGALIGACIGVAAGWVIATYAAPGGEIWIMPITGIVGFILGIWLIRGFHRFLFFFLGSTLGMAAGHTFFILTNTRVQWVMNAPGSGR